MTVNTPQIGTAYKISQAATDPGHQNPHLKSSRIFERSVLAKCRHGLISPTSTSSAASVRQLTGILYAYILPWRTETSGIQKYRCTVETLVEV